MTDWLILKAGLLSNIVACVVFCLLALRTRRGAFQFLAAALVVSLLPWVSSLIGPEVTIANDVVIRHVPYYVGRYSIAAYYLLILFSGIAFLRDSRRKAGNRSHRAAENTSAENTSGLD